MIALVFAGCVAAGAVVDVAGTAEARATEYATLTGAALQGGLSLRPSILGAVENPTSAFRASYSPQFTSVAPGDQLFLLVHTGEVGGEWRMPRLRLTGSAGITTGELDAATAQQQLFGSSSVVDVIGTFPYSNIGTSVGADARLWRTGDLSLRLRSDFSGSPGASVLPTIVSPGASGALSIQLARNHTGEIGVDARSGFIVDGDDSFYGAAPYLGWRMSTRGGLHIDARGGAGPYLVTLDGQSAMIVMPYAEGRAGGIIDLPGGAAMDTTFTTYLAPFVDPLGALFEQRAGVSFAGSGRARHDIVVGGELTAFAPLMRAGGRAQQIESGPTFGTRGTMSYLLMDRTTVDVSLLFSTRIFEIGPVFDATLSVGITGIANVFHSGTRPRGTDPRPGREIGETRIGSPPPPNVIAEPDPLPELAPVDDAAYLPLHAPPPNEPPPALKGEPVKSEPINPSKKKKAKKKSGDGDDDKDIDGDDDKDIEDDKPKTQEQAAPAAAAEKREG